jgi:8-oxo-dGTP pyrophosphatase MutT (NUDIX family)
MAFVNPRYTKTSPCTNCGEIGHHFRNCINPVTSYGIIAFRINEEKWNQASTLASSDSDFTGYPLDDMQYLLIQRRDSIGFVELLRAKYKLSDVQYIYDQVAGITQEERQKLLTLPFQELWVGLWGPTSNESRQYRQEYEQAKLKIESLLSGYDHNGTHIQLKNLFDKIPVQWSTPEWGFPKGRRNPFESDYACAVREFSEETGLTTNQFRIFENIEPIRETFFGNNGIHYRHVYYVAWISSAIPIAMNVDNYHMAQEIGGIDWFSLDDALSHIRPTNIEKRQVLLRVSSLLRNICPLLVGPVAELAEHSAKKEGDTTNRRPNESDGSIYRAFSRTAFKFVDDT